MIDKDIYVVPTHDEVNNILSRRNKLLLYHKRLYRKLRDIQGVHHSKPNNALRKFREYSCEQVGLNGINSHMYYLFAILNIKPTETKYGDIVKFLTEQGYISNVKSVVKRKSKFDSTHEAVSWMMAYRGTTTYFNLKFRRLRYESDILK